MQGAIQGLANVFLTLKSVRAQWRVIIGVRIYLAWSVGVICCHGKRLDKGLSASASCLFAFLNSVSGSFGWFSYAIRSGDVFFHLEVCVGRV